MGGVYETPILRQLQQFENCTNWKQYERITLVLLTVSSYSDLV